MNLIGGHGRVSFTLRNAFVHSGVPRAFAALVAGVEVGNEVVVVLLDQADLVHEADQRSYRECAAAEAEQKELVVRLEVVDDETVEVADVVLDAGAESAPRHLIERPARADAIVVENHLVDAMGVAGAYGAR